MLAALAVAASLALAVADEWPVRPCPPECTCEGVLAALDPMPPMELIECTVMIQGFAAKLLVPDTEGKNLWGRTEFIGIHSSASNPEMIFKEVGDDNFPYLSLMLLRPGDVVLDIGVSLGLFSLSVAVFHPEIEILGLEPNPWMAALARENLRRNGVSADRARILNAAMTGDGRNVTINVGRFLTTNSIYDMGTFEFYPGAVDKFDGKFDVPSMTLDQMRAEAGESAAKPVAIVKIDCEGCEYEFLDSFPHLTMPYFLGCHPHVSLHMGKGSRDPWELYNLCQPHSHAGANLFYEQGAVRDPVVAALAGLRAKAVVNMTLAASFFQLGVRSGEEQMEKLPSGLARQQYASLLEVFQRISAFFLATALEQGVGLPADQQAAAALFQDVAVREVGEPQGDGIRLLKHFAEPLKAMRTASMFRLGGLLRAQDNLEGARRWLAEASARGHAMADLELAVLDGTALTRSGVAWLPAKDGLVPAKERAALTSFVNMESMRLPGLFQLLAMSTDMGEKWEACAEKHQLGHIPTWQLEFGLQGALYQLAKPHRFRSWFLSAMDCWLQDVPEADVKNLVGA